MMRVIWTLQALGSHRPPANQVPSLLAKKANDPFAGTQGKRKLLQTDLCGLSMYFGHDMVCVIYCQSILMEP